MQFQNSESEIASKPSGAAIDPEFAARKLDRFFELCEFAKELALEGIRYRHPDAEPIEHRRMLAQRLDVFRAAKWRAHE